MKLLLIVLILGVLLGVPAALFFLSSPVNVELTPTPKALGADNTITVKVAGLHGFRTLSARVEQGGASSAAALEQPASRFMFWRKKAEPATYQLVVPAGPAKGFKSGPAKLTVTADSNDLRGQSSTVTVDVVINLAPPRVVADGEQHYINQGGAEVVLFTVSGYWTEAGVKVGGHKYRSFPMPGGKGEGDRFCIFAFPWDIPENTVPVVFASNPAGQEVTASFWYRIKPKKFRHRDLELTEAFIDKVLGELDPSGTGDKVARFLKINGEMRRANNAALANLKSETEQKFLWTPPFQQLSNSKVEAFFADVRNYTFDKKKIDQQVHLGFDLSKVQHAPVVASNSGKVVHAGPLGIYGNCIVVDHGYGLQSIYAHLSSISVQKGQMVKRGEEMGKSGSTGMAGGDHLHFSMQVDGVQVNPVEWWDPHWINDRVLKNKLGSVIRQE